MIIDKSSREGDYLRDIWWSQGVAFGQTGILNVIPEQAIIDTCKMAVFPNDHKIFALMVTWLKEYSSFIIVDSLNKRLKEQDSQTVALVGGLAKKCILFGDHRWKLIIKTVQQMLRSSPIHKTIDSEAMFVFHEPDLEILEFGLKVAVIKLEKKDKLKDLKSALSRNLWLRNRLIFRTNVYADIVTVFELGIARNGRQAAMITYCSPNTGNKCWKHIKTMEKMEIIEFRSKMINLNQMVKSLSISPSG